jgi:hypothetical protein
MSYYTPETAKSHKIFFEDALGLVRLEKAANMEEPGTSFR